MSKYPEFERVACTHLREGDTILVRQGRDGGQPNGNDWMEQRDHEGKALSTRYYMDERRPAIIPPGAYAVTEILTRQKQGHRRASTYKLVTISSTSGIGYRFELPAHGKINRITGGRA